MDDKIKTQYLGRIESIQNFYNEIIEVGRQNQSIIRSLSGDSPQLSRPAVRTI